MSQNKITSFFKNTKITECGCFIYDPENVKAFFSNRPEPTDIFVNEITKYNLKLYIRRKYHPVDKNIRMIDKKIYIPLCKSNLQKAIRRGNIETTLCSTIYMLQNDPIQLFRRIPIIEVEDVCLMSSYNVCVWLMMANNYHQVTKRDYYNVLLIVSNLCKKSEYINIHHDDLPEVSIKDIKNHKNRDILLGLFYRKEYGGLKGDIKMLNNVIYDLYNNKIEVYELDKKLKVNLPTDFTILPESIDFHCYPSILEYIQKNTLIDKDLIKTYIWNVESGLNFRKVETIESSKKYSNDETWEIIKKYLDEYRSTL